jgi:hypothetical protein
VQGLLALLQGLLQVLRVLSVPASRHWGLADVRRRDAAGSRHARRVQPAANSADAEGWAQLKARRQAASRPMAQVLLSEHLRAEARPSVQVPSERPVAEASQPLAPLAVLEAQPSEEPGEVQPWVAQAARPWEAQEAVQPSEEPAVQPLEVQAAQRVVQAAAEVQPVEREAEAGRLSAEREALLLAVQVRPLEARGEPPSAEPSVSSGPQVRPVRRRWTMSRREPAPAKIEWRRSQSLSAEGIECSSWSLWGEKK